MSSTELLEAASISTTSSELPARIALEIGFSGSKSTREPPSAFSAQARSLAMLVLPVPREPTNRYAWWTLSSSIALRSVRTMCSWPTTWSKLRGRWRRYSESTGGAILASAPGSLRAMSRRRGALVDWLAAGVIGALVFAWFGHAFLNYDTFYALVWGGDLAHGRTPDYGVSVAPTPHPLAELLGIVLTPFGATAEDLMLAIGLLALGMLAVGLFRLGQELFGVWAGLLAAAIIITRVPILSFGIRGYVDLPTAAFVVWACVLEVRKPRRGIPVFILLGLAGLLRPEAWLYAALYFAYLGFPWRMLAWAAAAPLIWLGSDLLITGNPLHSLTGTHDLAAQLNRKTGITALPEVAPRRLGEILRLPEALAAVAGGVFSPEGGGERAPAPPGVGRPHRIAYPALPTPPP